MYFHLAILLFLIIMLLFFTFIHSKNNPTTIQQTFKNIRQNSTTYQNTTLENTKDDFEGTYNISILYNFGYFKINKDVIGLTNDIFKIRDFKIKKNKLFLTPDNKSIYIDNLPLKISSTAMMSIDYSKKGTEFQFIKVNEIGGYYINIKGTELYLCCLSNQNLNKKNIEYKKIRVFAIPMDDNFVNWKDEYKNFNPFIFYFTAVNTLSN